MKPGPWALTSWGLKDHDCCFSITSKVLVIRLCPTLSNPMNCSPWGSSVLGILQTRILEWVAISFSRGSSQPEDWTQVSCTAGRFFTIWTTKTSHKCPVAHCTQPCAGRRILGNVAPAWPNSPLKPPQVPRFLPGPEQAPYPPQGRLFWLSQPKVARVSSEFPNTLPFSNIAAHFVLDN